MDNNFIAAEQDMKTNTDSEILDNLLFISDGPEELARSFHFYYERLAPNFGYETREDTKDFDPNSPNGKLMIAVCEKIINFYGLKHYLEIENNN